MTAPVPEDDRTGTADGGTRTSVAGRLGLRLRPAAGGRSGADASVLLGLAVRRNPRRAQLLVSRVLGKHVPTDPHLVHGAGLLLGGLVADALAGRAARRLPVALLHAAVRGEPGAAAALHRSASSPPAGRLPGAGALVLGYAETATALGHCVAEALQGHAGAGPGGVDYLHSTRRRVGGVDAAGGFTEEHSHATEHLLLPADPALLCGGRPLVLVDDELSTGRTALNTIRALHRRAPREHYVIATLADMRPTGDTLLDEVRECGARVDVVSLARAVVTVPPDVLGRAEAFRTEFGTGVPDPPPARPSGVRAVPDRRVDLGVLGWPSGLPVGGRHGFGPGHHRVLAGALPGLAGALARAAGLRPAERTLVLGTEELMALPLRLAVTLAGAGHAVAFSTTTRSPAVVVDALEYALRSAITFPAHDHPDDGPGPRYAYNLGRPGADPPWDRILVVVDPPADTEDLHRGLLRAVTPLARRVVLVVTP